MTPIRVRGKRTGTKEEKWQAGKLRKLRRYGSSTPSNASSSGLSTSSLAKTAARKSRKRADLTLSKLEQLPTEVLQSIFLFSANVDLPQASPHLASQLASKILQYALTTRILHEVLSGRRSSVLSIEVRCAARLMNSRFFTWPYFTTWLDLEFARLGLRPDLEEVLPDFVNSSGLLRRQQWTWYWLNPDPALPPPAKLLRRPFTDDNIQLLNCLVSSFHANPKTLEPAHYEMVQQGIEQLIEDGADGALNAMFCLGAKVDTELLRKAVIDAGCKMEIIQGLIFRATNVNNYPVDIDYLDPVLWAWADKAKTRGDAKGAWLIGLLQRAARYSKQEQAADDNEPK